MKYPNLNKTTNQKQSFCFSGGINTRLSKNGIFDDRLTESLNLISENGILRSRKGISPVADTTVGNYDSTGSMIKGLTLTDTEIYGNGTRKRIGYTVWGNSSYEDIYIYYVSKNGDLAARGKIPLTSSGGHFAALENIFFVVGKKKYSSGIYAFVKRNAHYSSADHYSYEIYEYDNSSGNYRLLSDSDFYTPIVYINGRGAEFDKVREDSWIFEEPPHRPEEINVLCGRFEAYYTSDGESASFVMPLNDLDDNYSVSCKIYITDTEYTEWVIAPGRSEKTESFMGQNIKMYCDRDSGEFAFFLGSDVFSIPKTRFFMGNNMKFTCVKKISKGLERIVGAKSSAQADGGTYVYTNSENRNEIFYCSNDNPLYFSQSASNNIGNTKSEILAIRSIGDNLYAFKSEGIYKITLTEESSKTPYNAPIGSKADFRKPTRLKTSLCSDETGLTNPNTLCKIGKKFIWLKDKKIYYFDKSNEIGLLSEPISGMLSGFSSAEQESAFALAYNGLYLIFFGKKVFALNCQTEFFGKKTKASGTPPNNENPAWFYFELPDAVEYIGGISDDKVISVICAADSVNYFSTFKGNSDVYLYNNGASRKKQSIPFSLATKTFDLGSSDYKNIISLNLQMMGESLVNIDVTGDNYTSKQEIGLYENSLSSIKILPFFVPVKDFSFKIKGSAPFTLRETNIEYNNR